MRGVSLSCTKAQVILLLERIEEELRDNHDKKVVREYIERIRKSAWAEIIRELF